MTHVNFVFFENKYTFLETSGYFVLILFQRVKKSWILKISYILSRVNLNVLCSKLYNTKVIIKKARASRNRNRWFVTILKSNTLTITFCLVVCIVICIIRNVLWVCLAFKSCCLYAFFLLQKKECCWIC